MILEVKPLTDKEQAVVDAILAGDIPACPPLRELDLTPPAAYSWRNLDNFLDKED